MPILATSINSPRDEGFKLAASLAARALDDNLHSHELLDIEDSLAGDMPKQVKEQGAETGTNQTTLRETLIALHKIMDTESRGEPSGHRIHLESGDWDGWHSWAKTECLRFTMSSSVHNCNISFSVSCEYRWEKAQGKSMLHLHPKLCGVRSNHPSCGKCGKRRGARRAEADRCGVFPMLSWYDSCGRRDQIRFRYYEHDAKLDVVLSEEDLDSLLKHPDMPFTSTQRSRLLYSGYQSAKKWKDKRQALIERSLDEDTDVRFWKTRTRSFN